MYVHCVAALIGRKTSSQINYISNGFPNHPGMIYWIQFIRMIYKVQLYCGQSGLWMNYLVHACVLVHADEAWPSLRSWFVLRNKSVYNSALKHHRFLHLAVLDLMWAASSWCTHSIDLCPAITPLLQSAPSGVIWIGCSAHAHDARGNSPWNVPLLKHFEL